MNKKLCSFLAVVMLMLQMGSISYAAEDIVEQKQTSILQMVVMYVDEEGVAYPVQGGSGFLIGDEASGAEYVVTAKEVTSVTDDTKQMVIEQFVPKEDRDNRNISFTIKAVIRRDVMVDAQLVAESDEMGFAVWKLSQQLFDRETLVLADEPLTGVSGKPATVLGFPTAPSLTGETVYYAMDEMISKSGMLIGDGKEAEVKYLYHNITPNMGMIGGPIINEAGNVVAINQSREAQEGYFALQMCELIPVLEALGIPYVTSSEVEAQRLAELAAIVHKENLQAGIQAAEALDADMYYKDTYAQVETCLQAAKAVNDNVEATQAEVDAACANLTQAMEGLEEKPPLWLILVIVFAVVAVLAIVFMVIWKKTKPKRDQKKQRKLEEYTVSEAAPVFGQSNVQKDDYRKLVAQSAPELNSRMPIMPQPQEEVYGETTVFQQDMSGSMELGPQDKKAYAFLIRKRTGETIAITSGEFVLGKDASQTDYCIAGNSAISRAHATIICKANEYAVADKNATNGTFVNGVKVAAFQKATIKNGDILRLADEEFEFKTALDA